MSKSNCEPALLSSLETLQHNLQDAGMLRIGVSATVDSTMIRFMECRGEGHIALTVTEAGRLVSWLHDMADGRWRDHNGYVPEVVK